MKYIITLLLSSLFIHLTYSQNLVPNGDFEEHDEVPHTFGQWQKCNSWTNASGEATPDFCMSGSFVPNDNIKAASGKGFMGIVTYITDLIYVEYISVRLSKHLVKGKKYNVSFWALADTNFQYVCPNLQLAFTLQPLSQFEGAKITSPYQYNVDDTPKNNSWQKFSFVFTPSFDCYYLTFGNFDKSNTSNQCINNRDGIYGMSYYYIDNVNISEVFEITGDTTICEGESRYLSAFGCKQCMWIDENNPNDVLSYSSMVSVSPKSQTTYIAKDLVNFKSGSITIHVKPRPKVDLGPDVSICHGDKVDFFINAPHSTLKWQDGSTEKAYTTHKAGSYKVEVSLDGCTSYDSVIVKRKEGCDFGIELPNIFTPNNDQKNDLFTPLKLVGIAQLETKIYNRWGSHIFTSHDPMINWNGEDADNGIYYWSIEYHDFDANQFNHKGTVELRR